MLASGCAVTTIDVDVYKGPLVNDEDVQVSQTAAMVTGARPLLLDLRNRIERDYRDSNIAKSAGVSPGIPEDVKSKFLQMPEHPNPKATELDKGWWFASPDAVRVNDILGLYEDSAPPEVRVLVDPLTRAHDTYVKNLESVVGPVAESGGTVPSPSQPAIGVAPASERQMRILEQENALRPATMAPTAASPSHGKRPTEALVEEPPTAKGRSDVSAVQQEQQALMQMWEASIALTQHLREDAFRKLPRYGAVQMDLAQLLSRLTNPSLLVVALYGGNPPSGAVRLRDSLERAIVQSLTILIDTPQADRPWGPVSDTLQSLLLVNPGETGRQLKETQDWFMSKQWAPAPLPWGLLLKVVSPQPPQLLSGLLPNPEDRQNFGLVSGVLCFTTDHGMCILASDTWSAVSLAADVGTSAGGGAGLEEGRLPQGISRLVEDYLGRRHRAARADLLLLAPQRDQLLSALANFAEKILFVANNSQLLAPSNSQSNAFDINVFSFASRLRQQKEVRVYERMLQAIGNSVLVQVDELRHQDQQAENDADLAPVEAQILSKIDPATTQPGAALASGIDLEGMLHPSTQPTSRPSELPNQGVSRRQVIDLLITKLNYEYTQAVIANGADGEFPKRLKQALEALYDRRAGMVYIRPPAAFLRDSYPVTSLQSSNQGPWTNELSREAARGMPFAEAGRDIIFHDQTSDAQTRQEIDKVFWQNINRIRVAGSGRTNYVMAKDDVGNWYVKGYSADPRDIIESAKEMATFAIGQPVQSDALEAALKGTNSADLQDKKQQSDQSNDQSTKGKGGKSAKQSRAQATTQTTALQNFQEGEFAKVNQSYGSNLADLNDRIVAQARQLEDVVNLAWSSHQISDPGLTEISHCAAERLKAALKPTTRPSDSADQLSDKIQANATALKTFRDDLLKGIYPAATQPATSEAAPTTTTKTAVSMPRPPRGPEVRPVMLDASSPSTSPASTSAPAETAPATTPSTKPVTTTSPTTSSSTKPAGCEVHTPLSLSAQQKQEAFEVGAKAVRAKLKPLLQDALGAIERYQAQLSVISGK